MDRRSIIDLLDRLGLGIEPDLSAVREPSRDEVLNHLLLSIDRDPAAGQRPKIDPMLLAVEAQLDAVMEHAFPLHAVADAAVDQQIGRSLLEDSGANALFDIVPASALEDDRLDALAIQQVRQHQAGRSGADDPDLRRTGQGLHPPPR